MSYDVIADYKEFHWTLTNDSIIENKSTEKCPEKMEDSSDESEYYDNYKTIATSSNFALNYIAGRNNDIWKLILSHGTKKHKLQLFLFFNPYLFIVMDFKAQFFIKNGDDEIKFVGIFSQLDGLDFMDECASIDVYFDFQQFVTARKYEIIVKVEVRPLRYKPDGAAYQYACSQNISKINMNDFLTTKKFSDIKIIASDNHVILAHKCVLIGASTVFEQLINADTTELSIDDLNGEKLNKMLEFIYTGSFRLISYDFDKKREMDEYLEFLQISHKYDLKKLKHKCIMYLDQNYIHENVVKVLNTAQRCNAGSLTENCIQYVKINFALLEADENWPLIDRSILMKLIKPLSEEQFKITELKSVKS